MESAASSNPQNLPAVKPAEPLAVKEPGEGFGNVHARDLVVPTLRIGQGTTREKGVIPGRLYSSLDVTDQRERLRLVPLAMRHGQALFPRTAEGKPAFDAPLVCGSSDGLVPMPSIEKPIAPACRDAKGAELCPAAKWDGNGKAPACQETHTWLVVDLETGIPYRFSVKRTDLLTSKKFLSNLIFRARANALSIYDFEFVLTTVQKTTPEGTWHAAVFTDVQPAKTRGMHKGLYEQFASAAQADVGGDHEGGDATGGAAAAKAPDEGKPATPAAGPQTAPPPAPPKGKSAKGRELDFS